jgi:hypothetical protein
MAEQRRPVVDQVLDRLVFGPIGVAAAVARVLPRAAEEGRKVVQGPLQTAQFVSQMAAGVVRARYGEQLRGVEERINEVNERLSSLRQVVEQVGGAVVRNVAQAGPRPWEEFQAPKAPTGTRAPHGASPTAGSSTGPSASSAATETGGNADVVGGIEGYSTLSAAEVIERLAALDAAQLAQVELHELEHRRRRTILARIAKLREERGGSEGTEASTGV